MFLTGTLLNVATVLVGTLVGVLIGSRMPARMQASLTTGLGLFTLLIGLSMGLRIFSDPSARPGDDLAVLGAVLLGVAVGDLIRARSRPSAQPEAGTHLAGSLAARIEDGRRGVFGQ